MKRLVTLALAISAAAAVALSFSPIGAATPDDPRMDLAPPPLVKPAGIDASALWRKTCAKCHGMDGKAQTPFADRLRAQGHKVPDLSTSDDAVEEFVKVITNGEEGTKMKAYGKRLGEKEIKALADFAFALRK